MTHHDRESFADAARLVRRDTGCAIELAGVERLDSAVICARYRLGNGLTILFVPDDRAPVFAYQTWFRVGSKDEDPNHTGLAHLFEHLMFKGTARHATGEFDREMERRGTQTNAATWVDWTFYHEALAATGDNLATVIDFEVDRMTGLALDEATFKSELEVVKNERRMAIDNSVSGRLNEALYGLAYTAHSYRWPTIGSMAHLEAASIEELRRFYRMYYAPNNAVVVVAGGLEAVPTLSLLAKSYGPIPAQPLARPARPVEPGQTAPRQMGFARPMVVPQIAVGYHAPPQLALDYAALQMLSEAIAEGDNARLYKRLVTDAKLATEVEGALMPFAEPGLYEVLVTVREGVDPEEVVRVLQEELDKLPQGLTPEEWDKARNSLELAFFDSWRAPWGIAEMLGHYETNYGDFAQAFRGQERLLQVTAADLSRVATEVFRLSNRTTVIACPSDTAAAEGEEGDEGDEGDEGAAGAEGDHDHE